MTFLVNRYGDVHEKDFGEKNFLARRSHRRLQPGRALEAGR
jgi:hypothetical protein